MRSAMYSLIEMSTGVSRFRLEHFKDRVVRGNMIAYEYILLYDKDIDIPFAFHWRDKLAKLQQAVKMEKSIQNG